MNEFIHGFSRWCIKINTLKKICASEEPLVVNINNTFKALHFISEVEYFNQLLTSLITLCMLMDKTRW